MLARSAEEQHADDFVLRPQRNCKACSGFCECFDLASMIRTEFDRPSQPRVEVAGSQRQWMRIVAQPVEQNPTGRKRAVFASVLFIGRLLEQHDRLRADALLQRGERYLQCFWKRGRAAKRS